MTLNFKLILDKFNRRFDEWEARWDQHFSPPPSMEPQPQDDPSVAFALIFNNTTVLGPANSGAMDDSVKVLVASTDPNALLNTVTADALETPSVDVGADVVADNWGGCFDDSEQYYGSPSVVANNWGGCFDGEQYRTRPSVVDDNWGGFFGGEDLASSSNPTRFVLPIASTDEPSIDIALARANSEAADDSVFVTTEPAGYDESELHATAVLDVLRPFLSFPAPMKWRRPPPVRLRSSPSTRRSRPRTAARCGYPMESRFRACFTRSSLSRHWSRMRSHRRGSRAWVRLAQTSYKLRSTQQTSRPCWESLMMQYHIDHHGLHLHNTVSLRRLSG
jgi:hypothetical protein